jgi:hypothetical protein
VTSSDDPASFASGSDLLRTSGQPWSRPLYNVSRSFIPLYQKLREDRLVSDELDSSLSTLPVKRLVYSLNQLLYTINDPFTVDFGPNARNLTVITERGMATIQLRKQFFDGRVCCRGFPYTGAYYLASSIFHTI